MGTFVGGVLHSLPFLIPDYRVALITALVVVAFELVALAVLRARFFSTRFTTSLGAVSLAGAVIVAVSVALGVDRTADRHRLSDLAALDDLHAAWVSRRRHPVRRRTRAVSSAGAAGSSPA